MPAIASTFATLRAQGRAALIPYFMTGYPSPDETITLVEAAVKGGAAIIELGVPFSDPLADGATIQRAGYEALQHGVTLDTCLETTATLRARGVDVPIVLMGYYNPIVSYGLERCCARAAQCGVSGFIVPDLPPEEAEPLAELCQQHNLSLIFLAAPTSPPDRLRAIAQRAHGFIYCVSLSGVTGARTTLPTTLHDFVDRVRAVSDLPLAVGFGITTPAHAAAVARIADGVVCGSALINLIDQLPKEQRAEGVERFVREMADAAKTEAVA